LGNNCFVLWFVKMHGRDDKDGLKDVLSGIKRLSLPLFLARSDIRQRYRRSTLGPFWLTISTGVMIACLGLIFGKIFKAPASEFLPFLASGLILWGFIAQVISESTEVFITSEAIIKQLQIPYFCHVLRLVARNVYILFHNLLILPLVYITFSIRPTLDMLLFIPGLILLIINLLWICLTLGVICTRFRDLTQVVNSCLQIAFYVTPIIWMPSLLPARASVMLLDTNPFYHFLEIVRSPLLNQAPSVLNWTVSIVITILGWAFTLSLFNRYRNRVAYWL